MGRSFRCWWGEKLLKPAYIDLFDIIESDAFGPVAIGKGLDDIGRILAPPDYWGFGSEKFFSTYLGFGSVEVHFQTQKNMPRVFYAELHMRNFFRGVAKFGRLQDGRDHRIKNNFAEKWLSYDFLAKEFSRRKIEFDSRYRETVSSDTSAVMNFGNNVKFYFADKKKPTLGLICLSADHAPSVGKASSFEN